MNVSVFAFWQGGLHTDMRQAVRYGAIPHEISHPGSQCLIVESVGYQCADAATMEATYGIELPPAWETVFTSMFMHLTWWHLAATMLLLFVFGVALEGAVGGGGLLVFYLVGGLASTLLRTLFEPLSAMPMLGASGAVAGIMGAYVVIYPRAKIFTWLLPPLAFVWGWVRAVWLALAMLLAQVVLGYFALKTTFGEDASAAYFAHFGSFAVGAAIVWTVFDRKTLSEHRRKARVYSGDEPSMLVPRDPVSTYRTFSDATAHTRWVRETVATVNRPQRPQPAAHRRRLTFRRKPAAVGRPTATSATRYPTSDPFVPSSTYAYQRPAGWQERLKLERGSVPRPPGC